MQFDVQRSLIPSSGPEGVILRVSGDLDMAGAPQLRGALVSEVAGGARLVIIDLAKVDYLDSAGLGVLVGALRRLRVHDGDLLLVCPEPRIRQVLELCDLDRVFDLHTGVETALAAFSNR